MENTKHLELISSKIDMREKAEQPTKPKKQRIGRNEIGRYDPVTKQWIWRN